MIHPGLSFAEYDALPGYNASLLKVAANQTLAHARAYIDGYRKESDAMDFGTSFHALVLEGKEDFIIRPDTYPTPADHADVKSKKTNPDTCAPWKEGDPRPWTLAAKACKEWLCEHNPNGLTVHTAAEVADMRGMAKAVREHPDLAPILALGCRFELAVTAERNGIAYKGLLDIVPPRTLPKGYMGHTAPPIIDLKSCTSARPELFVKDILSRGYHIQAALNLDLLSWQGDVRTRFWFAAIESAFPYAIWIAKLEDASPSIIRMGRAKYRQAVSLLEQAKKSGEWPSYPRDVQPEALIPGYLSAELDRT